MIMVRLRIVLLLVIVAGCASTRPDREEVRRQMERARGYEAAGNIPEAARQYAAAAAQFPGSEWSVVAARKAATLYAYSQNPERSDSAALYWFRLLQTEEIPGQEKDLVQVQIATLERSQLLVGQIARQKESADSLTAETRRLTSMVTSQSRQILELQAEVKRLAEELRLLKEIDVRLSKRKQAR